MQRVSSVADLVDPLQRLSTPSACHTPCGTTPPHPRVRFGPIAGCAAPVGSPGWVLQTPFMDQSPSILDQATSLDEPENHLRWLPITLATRYEGGA